MGELRMFVNGQAMSGGSISGALADATLLGAAITAPEYRFYSVRDEFPGLYPDTDDGTSVPGELYALSYETLRDALLPREPPELELTVIRMADGSAALAMRMREDRLGDPGVVDISDRGGWHAHLAGVRGAS